MLLKELVSEAGSLLRARDYIERDLTLPFEVIQVRFDTAEFLVQILAFHRKPAPASVRIYVEVETLFLADTGDVSGRIGRGINPADAQRTVEAVRAIHADQFPHHDLAITGE